MSPRRTLILTVAILVAYNVARGLGSFPNHAGVIVLVVAIVAILGAGGISRSELGLEPKNLVRGAQFGLAALAATIAVLLVVAAIPATSGFLDDARAKVSGAHLGYEIFVSIFLVTVLPEELAFRGLLLATGRRSWSDLRAATVSSVLFGLWHISPTLGTMSANRQLTGASTLGTVGVVAGSVAITTVAGFVFCWLRLRSQSLIAPIVAHWATNSVALIAAWLSMR